MNAKIWTGGLRCQRFIRSTTISKDVMTTLIKKTSVEIRNCQLYSTIFSLITLYDWKGLLKELDSIEMNDLWHVRLIHDLIKGNNCNRSLRPLMITWMIKIELNDQKLICILSIIIFNYPYQLQLNYYLPMFHFWIFQSVVFAQGKTANKSITF